MPTYEFKTPARGEADITKSSLLGLPLNTVYDKNTGAAIRLDDIPEAMYGDTEDDMHGLPDHCTMKEMMGLVDTRLRQLHKIEGEARTLISQMTMIAREWREAEEQYDKEPDPFERALSDVVTLRLTICDSDGVVHGRDHRVDYGSGYIRETVRVGALGRGEFVDDLKSCLGELIRHMIADINK